MAADRRGSARGGCRRGAPHGGRAAAKRRHRRLPEQRRRRRARRGRDARRRSPCGRGRVPARRATSDRPGRGGHGRRTSRPAGRRGRIPLCARPWCRDGRPFHLRHRPQAPAVDRGGRYRGRRGPRRGWPPCGRGVDGRSDRQTARTHRRLADRRRRVLRRRPLRRRLRDGAGRGVHPAGPGATDDHRAAAWDGRGVGRGGRHRLPRQGAPGGRWGDPHRARRLASGRIQHGGHAVRSRRMSDSGNAGELVALALKSAGVSHLFTLNGGHIWPVLMGATEHRIRIVDVRHEQSAAFAAEGWAKVTREVGVAAVTAWPGVTNSTSALAQALGSDSPMFVVAGGGVWWARAEEELSALVEGGSLPLLVNGMARGMLPPSHPLFFSRARSRALRESDVALVLGARLDFRLNFGQPPVFGDDTRIIRLDVDSGDLKTAIHWLAQAVAGAPQREGWIAALRETETAARKRAQAMTASDSSPVHPARLIAEIDRFADPDAIVVGDGGDFVSFAGRLIERQQPGLWIDPGPFGCLGSGPDYAMAARLARPDRQVILLSGDGAFGFSAMEFDTMVRHRIPVVCVVGNNGIWALEKHPMRSMLGVSVAADLGPGTRYDRVEA